MSALNFLPGSPEHGLVAGPVDRRGRRIWPLDGVVDAQVAAGTTEAEKPTHPEGGRIGHVFVSASLAGAVRGVRVDRAVTGSDHCPVRLELAVETAGPA